MKYQKFHIENFKGINKLDLDLNKHPNSKIFTLVGLNESGKTTVLEALDFFKNDEEPEKSYKFIPKSKKSNFNGSIKVQADFILEDEDIKTIKEYAEEELNFEIKTLSKEFSVTKRYGFESSKYKDQGNTWSIDIKGYRLTEETKEDSETETVKSELIDTGKDDDEWQSLVKKIREASGITFSLHKFF